MATPNHTETPAATAAQYSQPQAQKFTARRPAKPRPPRHTSGDGTLRDEQPIATMIVEFGRETVWEGPAARDWKRTWPVIAGVDLSGLRARDGQGEGEIRVQVFGNGTAKARAVGYVTTRLLEQVVMNVNLIRAGLEMGVFG